MVEELFGRIAWLIASCVYAIMLILQMSIRRSIYQRMMVTILIIVGPFSFLMSLNVISFPMDFVLGAAAAFFSSIGLAITAQTFLIGLKNKF